VQEPRCATLGRVGAGVERAAWFSGKKNVTGSIAVPLSRRCKRAGVRGTGPGCWAGLGERKTEVKRERDEQPVLRRKQIKFGPNI
jgi:hypothetical protein